MHYEPFLSAKMLLNASMRNQEQLNSIRYLRQDKHNINEIYRNYQTRMANAAKSEHRR